MKKFAAVVAFGVLIGGLSSASAATVSVSNGSVSVNGGKPTLTSATVKLGDQVTVGPSGKARIAYAGACFVDVGPGETVVVISDDQCAASFSNNAGLANPAVAAGVAVVAGAVVVGVLVANSNTRRSP